MPLQMFEIYKILPVFLLVLFRVSGLMLAAPLFSSPAIPLKIKVLMAVAMSMAIFPMLLPQVVVPVTLASAVVGLFGELLIGMFIGFGVTLVFMGVQIAGQLIGHQAGMGLGNVFNPMLEASMGVTPQLFFFIALMIFLAVGGDRAVIRALLDSFTAIPPLEFELSSSLVVLLVDMMALSFAIAIRVGGPTILALLLVFLAMGFITRTVPQMNILTIGFPIKAMVALIIMALTVMSLEPVLLDSLTTCMDGLRVGLGLN